VIEVLGDDDETEPPTKRVEPTISIHALIGIQPSMGRTMQVYITINDAKLWALLDSGSTHNFVDSEATEQAGIIFRAQAGLRVAVANNDHMASSGCCHDLKISIAGDDFVIDCYGLALGSYEMVLGVQWLESLGPILWDFGRWTMSFVRNGRAVKWSASSPPEPLGPSIAAATTDIKEEMLLRFASLFVEPNRFPPPRQWSHQIRLLSGMPPIIIHLYRYTQH
jgi:hypothetical protein